MKKEEKEENIDAGEDLNNTKEILKKKLFDELTTVLVKEKHTGKNPLTSIEIAEVLQDRYDDLLHDIELDANRIHEYELDDIREDMEKKNDGFIRKNLEKEMDEHSLDKLILEHIAHERFIRHKEAAKYKEGLWNASANNLKKRGYGGLVYNIKKMSDPSDIEEINEIIQLADDEYGETTEDIDTDGKHNISWEMQNLKDVSMERLGKALDTLSETKNNPELYNEVYEECKRRQSNIKERTEKMRYARMELFNGITKLIDEARNDEEYPLCKMEILGQLELIKLFYFRYYTERKEGEFEISDFHNAFRVPINVM